MYRELQTMAYYETYYYANVIGNVLKDTNPYLRNLNDWHEDREGPLFLTPFPKWSVLHDLSQFIILGLAYEQIDDIAIDSFAVNGDDLWVDKTLRYHGFTVPGFRPWLKERGTRSDDLTEEDANDYYSSLFESGELGDLLEHLSNEVFFLLFANRSLLSQLNEYAAAAVSHVSPDDVEDEHAQHLSAPGVLRRTSIPEWARRAVYFRDRGRCVLCNCDLTGLVSLQNDDHFDHIIPLKQSGLNDVTNLQLLCASCNQKKGARLVGTSDRYERWY
jgi:hypothetical protein